MNKIILNKNNLGRKYADGTESYIYFYKQNNTTVFIKLFKTELQIEDNPTIVTKETLENKRKKIELIPTLEEFKDEIKILNLVYDENDNFIGYTMKISSLITARSIDRTKKRIEILKLVKEKMETFNKHDIYISDFNQSNILITDTGIKFCDLDNFRIKEFDSDLKTLFQHTYLGKCTNIENMDNYCFNFLTVAYIGRIFEPYVLYNLRQNGLPRKLDTKENRKLIEELINIDNSYEKKYLIDNMRKFL